MFWNAKNCNIKLDDFDIDYITFGTGRKNLILIPGLGDGLKTVKGTAHIMALAYKKYAKEYKVFVFSRTNTLKENESIKGMAETQVKAMKSLGIKIADIIGVSQGGMIAQCIAIDYPEIVNKLILTVTLSRQNSIEKNMVTRWIDMAKAGDYKNLFIDTMENSYTEKYLKKYRMLYPILVKFSRPKSLDRFIIQANAILKHNTYEELGKIKCPVLIIGAENDRIVGPEASKEIAGKIENGELLIYKGFGHSVYEEAKDFNDRVLEFLSR